LNRYKVKKALRIVGSNSLVGRRTELNRWMKQIMDEDVTLKQETEALVSQLFDITASRRDASMLEWLPVANELYENLSQDYEWNGQPKW